MKANEFNALVNFTPADGLRHHRDASEQSSGVCIPKQSLGTSEYNCPLSLSEGYTGMIFTQSKKLSPLEKMLLALSLIPLIATFSLWKLIWVLPLCLAALHFIHGENPRHGRFILLAIVATLLTALSFATQVWMEQPPRHRTFEYYTDWQSHDFGMPWWFVFDLTIHVAIVSVAARLAFGANKPAGQGVVVGR